jgi:hypothetical protein
MITVEPRSHDPAATDVERMERAYRVFEMVAAGASINQIANTIGISRTLVRSDLRAVVEELNQDGVDRTLEIREEILARQRSLILHNRSMAERGDGSTASRNAAAICQKADDLIASITGVRYYRVEVAPTPRTPDPVLAAALDAYTTAIEDTSRR